MGHWKTFFGPGWQVARRWRILEPSERRMIMPESVLRAGVAVSMLWGWPRFAAMLLMGFTGLAHPSTLLMATREDLLLPRDTLSERRLCFLRIRHPKTKRYMVRQHLRISDEVVVDFLDRLYGHAEPDCRLFDLGHGAFRLRWDHVFRSLGLPVREDQHGITQGCMRGSGATYLYNATETFH